MRFRLLRVVCLLTLFGFAVALLQARAAEERRGRPIEFSDPKGSTLSTNFHLFEAKSAELQDLEGDLSKFLPHTFAPQGSLDGMEAAPLRTPINPAIIKKQKEARDRRVNWVWQNPAELTSGPTAEELFKLPQYGPDGREKKKSSASVESYYERLQRERRHEDDPDRDKDPTRLTRSTGPEDDLKPEPDDAASEPVSEGERTLRRLFDSQPATQKESADSIRTSATDIFGLGNNTAVPSPEQLESQKILRDQFNSLFAPAASSGGLTEMQNSLSGISDKQSFVTSSQSEALSSATKPAFGPTLGTISSPFNGSALPDLNSKDLSSPWSSPADSTKVELPKFWTAPTVFDFPRRKF